MKQLKYISLTPVTGKINYFQSSAKHVDLTVLVVTSILINHYNVESQPCFQIDEKICMMIAVSI
mgnify:CR=1 FL=1